ncbi:hypothetical protein [Pseudoruegeria sp. SHC-113]|uniref:hypothetical protein n=1 Tax=Pseudoruegeria sp. SHC-113 TaxID=2855439 RepID=UPI0021BB6BE5|nr:hypothetical protein [Pseudoruegeria sp. SHC-113]MCT8160904.1 hypothetical protein [Pseudoruegeria sp. SHC-113]
MVKMMISAAFTTLANAVGLLLAWLLLPNFSIDFVSFVIVVLLFTVITVVAGPLLTKMSLKNLPALQGGVALVTVFVGLVITNLILPGLTIGGIANLLAATLLVWLGSLIAAIVLPMYLFKETLEKHNAK